MQESENPDDGVPKLNPGNNSPEYKSELWNDWKWQFKNRLRTVKDLETFGIKLSIEAEKAARIFPMAVTPYYANLFKNKDENDPVLKMAIPSGLELLTPSFLKDDPLDESGHSPVPHLVHRYQDRALLISTSTCNMFCRYCTRKRVTGQKEYCIDDEGVKKWVEYLKSHPEIKDVVLSGGDPLTMPTKRLDEILTAIRSVESVEIIRIGTRVPVVLPMRVDDELANMLRKHHPIYVNTHFNHPNEITLEATEACRKLADAGIPLGNQSVLLRGVNDNVETIIKLCRMLIKIRVKPYYLFICDLVKGVEHFRTSVNDGIEIIKGLRGRLSGIAIPTFVVDGPDGVGKTPVLPNYVLENSENGTIMKSWEGKEFVYPNPTLDKNYEK